MNDGWINYKVDPINTPPYTQYREYKGLHFFVYDPDGDGYMCEICCHRQPLFCSSDFEDYKGKPTRANLKRAIDEYIENILM